ncbi:MAG TPA: SRPBCC family protein [Bacteroidia bacterium]|nr:SRPBCC family protein [Bacteroidia bacterium]
MRAIQNYLPNPRHTEIHRIFVNAKPEVAWQAARHFDMSEVPWIKLLFDIRTLPDKLCGKEKTHEKVGLGVDQIAKSDAGFMILHETPGKEVVVGSVGQFWHLKIPFKKIGPDKFRNFNNPGYGKIAWAISVEPFREGSTISLELRTSATDERSWKNFNNYYRFIGIGSHLIRNSVMSHFEAELGKMKLPDDDHRTLSGDELIPGSKYGLTFHRDIEAPVSIVWRYLMQLGCDRAGWYSIDALDNGGKPSTDYLVKGWETRNVGDKLSATPEHDSFFNVYAVEHEKYFVIGGETERMGGPFKMTWSFVLEPIGKDATHLITRARFESSPKWKEWLMGNVIYPPIHSMMTITQINSIKGIAERDAKARSATAKIQMQELEVENK